MSFLPAVPHPLNNSQVSGSTARPPRKRLDLPWQTRQSSISSAKISSDGILIAPVAASRNVFHEAEAVLIMAKELGTLLGLGAPSRMEFDVHDRVRCVVQCNGEDALIESVRPLQGSSSLARIPIASQDSPKPRGFHFEAA